jgi:hypothetical protein
LLLLGRLRIETERIVEEVRLLLRRPLLLFGQSAEQEIEQALGGGRARRQRQRCGEHDGRDERKAMPPALKMKPGTQRLTPRNTFELTSGARPHA